MKAIYWLIGSCVLGLILFVYVLLGDTQKSVPKIQLSYFVNETEIAESVLKRLSQELLNQKNFIIGIEPDKAEQFDVVISFKQKLEQLNKFDLVLVDQELGLKPDVLQKLGQYEVKPFKSDLAVVNDLLVSLEEKQKSYFVVTANIYSNPILKKNQLNQMKERKLIKPITFSFAYFPVRPELEQKMLFPCVTEDHAGTSDWGCAVANKSRFTRRKIDFQNQKTWVGLMDLIGEKDYMILLYKK